MLLTFSFGRGTLHSRPMTADEMRSYEKQGDLEAGWGDAAGMSVVPLILPRRSPTRRAFGVVPHARTLLLTESHPDSLDPRVDERCAWLAMDALLSLKGADPISGLLEAASRAHRQVAACVAETGVFASTSFAAVTMGGSGEVDVVWAGTRTRVHHIRRGGGANLITRSEQAFLTWEEAKQQPKGHVAFARDAFYLVRELGAAPRRGFSRASVALAPGDRLLMSCGWKWKPAPEPARLLERAEEDPLLALVSDCALGRGPSGALPAWVIQRDERVPRAARSGCGNQYRNR